MTTMTKGSDTLSAPPSDKLESCLIALLEGREIDYSILQELSQHEIDRQLDRLRGILRLRERALPAEMRKSRLKAIESKRSKHTKRLAAIADEIAALTSEADDIRDELSEAEREAAGIESAVARLRDHAPESLRQQGKLLVAYECRDDKTELSEIESEQRKLSIFGKLTAGDHLLSARENLHLGTIPWDEFARLAGCENPVSIEERRHGKQFEKVASVSSGLLYDAQKAAETRITELEREAAACRKRIAERKQVAAAKLDWYIP